MLETLSQSFGTGDSQRDALIILVGLAFILFLIGVREYFRGRTPPPEDGFDRVSSMLGRMEKLEMTINEFKTEALRNFEFFRNDLGFLRQEIEDLRHGLGQASGRRPGSSSGGGFNPEGGTDGGGFSTGGGGSSEPSSGGGVGGNEASAAEPAATTAAITAAFERPSAQNVLATKLAKTRSGLFQKIKELFSGKPKLEAAMLDELEAQLVSSDLGIKTTTALLEELKSDIASGQEIGESGVAAMLKMKVLGILEADAPLDTAVKPIKRNDGPTVVLVVGVNGAGKTTTVAKLASQWKEQGARVLMVAADTFRAAAVDQLVEWGTRLGVPVVSGAPEAKPSTVIFDAMTRAQQEPFDVIIIDTAGRLHTKSNLMQELEGIKNTIKRHQPLAPHETLLVVDGSTGSNALSQAKEFNEATPLSGLIVTKLDGTPKGGIVVAIKSELGVPVRYIGVGEAPQDLRIFVARDFVEALFDTSARDMTESTKLSAHAEVRRSRRGSAEVAIN